MGVRIIVKGADFSVNKVATVSIVDATDDSDVTAYLAYTKAKDSTFADTSFKSALNTLVKKMKLFGIWDRLDVFYPFLGLTKEAQSVSLKNFATTSDILFFPRTNTSGGETIAKFISEGYETHNFNIGNNITNNNIAVVPILDAFKTHLSDLSVSISGFVKADDSGRSTCDFAFGNFMTGQSITVAGNRFILGNNNYCGIGYVTPPLTPSTTYSTTKKMFTYSLVNNTFTAFENKSLLQTANNVTGVDVTKFSNAYFGLGFATNSVNVVSNGVLQTALTYQSQWGKMNFVYDNLFIGRSLSTEDVNTIHSLLNEFRNLIGRQLAQ